MSNRHVQRPRGRPPAATREQVLDAVTQRFLAGERIDIQAICSELGLSRATVHRWYGSRDGVIGAAIVKLVVPLFRRIERSGQGAGAERLVDVFERQLRALADHRAFRRFLEHELRPHNGFSPPPMAWSSRRWLR